MNEREFCYWLQGFFELNGDGVNSLTMKQVDIVKNHLNLVFKKVTPNNTHTYCLSTYDGPLPLTTTHTGVIDKATC